MTSVSVVVISLNEGDNLKRTVDSLRATLPEGSEIIVVDDGSTDGSTDFLADAYPGIVLLRPPSRLGVAGARNFGASHATGDVLVFSDAHVIVPPGWVEGLLDVLAGQEVGAVAPAIAAMPNAAQCTGFGQKWEDATLAVGWLDRHGREPYPVPLICGCFLAMRREVFNAIGLFDPGMVLWGAEDSELSIRLWLCGYDCRIVPGVEVRHAFRARFPYEVKWEPVLHNRLRMASLHFGPRRLTRVIERLKQYDEFSAASVRLLTGDLGARSAHLRSLRRRDDDWFFDRFRNELGSELCELSAAKAAVVSVPDSPSVSACLLSWKRPGNLPAIIRSLRRSPHIDEILVWNNNPATELKIAEPGVRVIDSPENQGCYGRFLCAAQARNPVVYVQDDDALNHDIDGLYTEFLRDPTRIAHALTPSHWNLRNRRVYGEAQAALLGWGAFFRKDWLPALADLPDSLKQSRLFRREADAFFTVLLERRHHAVPGQIEHLEGHSTPGIALWCDQDYQRKTSLAIRQALRRLRLKKNPAALAPWNIVIPCRNYGRYLLEAVESVLALDADYEVHIVDDESTDETASVADVLVRRYPHVHYLRNETQRGPGYSRNRGIAAYESAFVVTLDADDLLGPDFLFEAGRRLERGADVVNPDAVVFGEIRERWVVPELTTYNMLLQRNSVHCSSAFRRELWAAAGGLDEHIPCWEDYHFWLRLAAAGARIVGVHGDHFLHRRHADSLSQARNGNRTVFLEYLRQSDEKLFGSFAGKAGASIGG